MKLNELQAKIDDQLMMARIYSAIADVAICKGRSINFLHTDEYPNRHNSVINKQQITQLEADGYTVVDVSEHGRVYYVVSGWKIQSKAL